jgi:hypothetical protein
MFLVIMHWWIFNWQISFLYFSFIGSNAVQQNIIRHQFDGLGKDHSSDETSPVFEFGPALQDPFSFCQIQLALDTVHD